jgi:cytoplasmic iron level regulating protein YaaA (DUF328/UPF0246 family)
VLLLLPPSETKREGGQADQLDLAALGFPELTAQRRRTLSALRELSRSIKGSMAGLGLSPNQRDEIDRNRAITRSPVLPAIERYTGVLYDGLDAATLNSEARQFAAQHVVVHSALFGLLRADDPIPAYRLSHDSRLPGLRLRPHWREAVTATLTQQSRLILDLRSESYVALGPAPAGTWYVRVLSEDERGQRVALSHFNKKAKGEFVRAVVENGGDFGSVDDVLSWAAGRGIRLSKGAEGELDLVV